MNRARTSYALMALAMLLGGGSAVFATTRMIVELVAAVLIAMSVAHYHELRAERALRVPLIIGAALVGLVALQLVPLPPELWTALPGRALPADIARALGGPGWRPLSLDPEATVRAALVLLPGIAMFLAVVLADARQQVLLIAIFVVGAAFSLLLGLAQLGSSAELPLFLYASGHNGMLNGVFANRNHQAILLAMAIPGGAVLYAIERPRFGPMAPWLAGLAAVVVALGVMATGSRTGSALLPIALTVALLLAIPPRALRPSRLLLLGLLCLAACAATVVVIVMFGQGALAGQAAKHLPIGQDDRFEFWPDVVYAIGQYWPVGSGIGTFPDIFGNAERLSSVGPHYLNHAHNDYLEIAVETGIFGLALAAAAAGWVALKAWQVWRVPDTDGSLLMARAAAAMLALVLLHSVVDYPLRTLAVSTVAGLCLGLLACAGVREVNPVQPRSLRGTAPSTRAGHFVGMGRI